MKTEEQKKEFKRCAKLYAQAFVVPVVLTFLLYHAIWFIVFTNGEGSLHLPWAVALLILCPAALLTPSLSICYFGKIPLNRHISHSTARIVFVIVFVIAVYICAFAAYMASLYSVDFIFGHILSYARG